MSEVPARRRLAELAAVLQGREDALGLLALGSVGRELDRLDRWSDLDFFVIVRPGAKPAYLERLDWLSDAHPIVWHFRNTADGHKALMADGLFCEFAVFEPAELSVIPYAPGRFEWRREELPEALAEPQRPVPGPPDRQWLIGEALSNLLVGLARYQRGERLAGMRMVQVFALDRVLELLDLDSGPEFTSSRDRFAVERRVEQRHPELGPKLAMLAGGYCATPAAALGLLALLNQHAEIPSVVSEQIRSLAAVQK